MTVTYTGIVTYKCNGEYVQLNHEARLDVIYHLRIDTAVLASRYRKDANCLNRSQDR